MAGSTHFFSDTIDLKCLVPILSLPFGYWTKIYCIKNILLSKHQYIFIFFYYEYTVRLPIHVLLYLLKHV